MLICYSCIPTNLSKVKECEDKMNKKGTAGNLEQKNGMVENYVVEYPKHTGRSNILLLNQLWPYCTELAL